MALEVTIPAEIIRQIANRTVSADLNRTEPVAVAAKDHYTALQKAAVARAAAIAPEASPLLVANREYIPQPDQNFDVGRAASVNKVVLKDGRPGSIVNINPNVDASYYAHELGHAVSQKNKVGKFINDARHKLKANPKLGGALKYALGAGLAGSAAALQEGDDDLIESIALAAAVASPTLIDEALATKNGLAIMNDAGIRANMGQRARLAGAYLSYLAPVLIAGSVANAAGNLVDDHTALYDL